MWFNKNQNTFKVTFLLMEKHVQPRCRCFVVYVVLFLYGSIVAWICLSAFEVHHGNCRIWAL